MHVVVIGGGYAGLSALIGLRRHLADVELSLIDPRPHHIKITRLHETLHRPLSEFCIPFARLGERFGFTHRCTGLAFDETDLVRWQQDKALPLPDGPLAFDYLVIATGARPRPLPDGARVYDRDDFCNQEGREILQSLLTDARERHISVVGAGATGIQFLFEFAHCLKAANGRHHLRLINRNGRILPDLPRGFHDYIHNRLADAGIEYIPNHEYSGQDGDMIRLQEVTTQENHVLPSDLTLLFPGVAPYPESFQTNRYGRVMAGKTILANIFAAGDCSQFSSRGLNALTAQAAVRKGRRIAENIKRLVDGRLPYIYSYGEKGYFISMGPCDGIGWISFKHNIVKGLAALAIKGLVETQYDLFTEGVDLYF